MKLKIFSAAVLAMATCAFGYDTSSYVQSGLIANWDGIDRGGLAEGVYLDQPMVGWADCVGSRMLYATNAYVTAKGLAFPDKWSYGTTPADLNSPVFSCAGKTLTMQVVCTIDSNASKDRGVLTTTRGYCPGLFVGKTYTTCDTYGDPSKVTRTYAGISTGPSVTNIFTVVYTNNYVKSISVDGVELALLPEESWQKPGGYSYGAGGTFATVGRKNDGSATNPMGGALFALRFYSRELTSAELDQNKIVDQSRFMGIEVPTYTVAAQVDGEPAVPAAITPACATYPATGESVAFSVAAAMSNYVDGVRALAVSDDERALYAGATVTNGDGTVSFTTNETFSVTFAPGDSFVVWNFTNAECRLVATAGQGGTVSEAESWHVRGSEATISAIPDTSNGMGFAGWTGDVSGVADVGASTISLTMTSPRSVAAAFRISPYPDERYPVGYDFYVSGWTNGAVTVLSEAQGEAGVEGRYRTRGALAIEKFDSDATPKFILYIR